MKLNAENGGGLGTGDNYSARDNGSFSHSIGLKGGLFPLADLSRAEETLVFVTPSSVSFDLSKVLSLKDARSSNGFRAIDAQTSPKYPDRTNAVPLGNTPDKQIRRRQMRRAIPRETTRGKRGS